MLSTAIRARVASVDPTVPHVQEVVSMKRGIVVLILTFTFAFASSAQAAPGDPRLVQGMLVWPAKLTVEPFVVVLAEDGGWYYAEIKTAKRLESAPLSAGARVAVLGTEATRPYEITAIALGSGDAAALAMALMPHVTPTAAASVPPPPPIAESLNTSKPAATEPLQTAKTVAKPEPVAVAAPVPPAKASQPPASDATASAKSQVTEPPTEKATAVKAVDQSKPVATPLGVPADSPGWSELRGTVEVVSGNWVVVRTADRQLVLVDLSTVSGGAGSLKPGSAIAVYGTPGEQKFQAMGLVHQENRPPARPVPVPPRR